MVTFGYSERKDHAEYDLVYWVRHIIGFMDAMGIEKTHLIGNSFGGALSLATASRHLHRVDPIVLNGAAGTNFKVTKEPGNMWGYQPSPDTSRRPEMLISEPSWLDCVSVSEEEGSTIFSIGLQGE